MPPRSVSTFSSHPAAGSIQGRTSGSYLAFTFCLDQLFGCLTSLVYALAILVVFDQYDYLLSAPLAAAVVKPLRCSTGTSSMFAFRDRCNALTYKTTAQRSLALKEDA